jgi:hypothetical protein
MYKNLFHDCYFFKNYNVDKMVDICKVLSCDAKGKFNQNVLLQIIIHTDVFLNRGSAKMEAMK